MRCHPAAVALFFAALLPSAGCAPVAVDPIAAPSNPSAPTPSPAPPRSLPDDLETLSAVTATVRRRPDRTDLSGDGLPDLAVGAPQHRRVTVFPSAAAAPVILDRALAGFGAALAYVGDLDGDGYPDLAVGAPAADTVVLFGGSPGGVDPTPRAVLTGEPGSGFGATLAAVGDLDDDDRADLVVGSVTGHAVSLVRGRSDAMPARVSARYEGPADEGFATAMSALGDGRVAVALPGEGAVLVLTARDGVFALRARLTVAETRLVDVGMAALDGDGDGHTDLALTGGGLGGVVWIRGTVDGFAAPTLTPGGSGAGTVLANATDLDGDGDDELLLSTGARVWLLAGSLDGGAARVPWSVARSGSTAALSVLRGAGHGTRATVLRGVPGEDAVEVLTVGRDLRATAAREPLTGARGSAFGAAVAR